MNSLKHNTLHPNLPFKNPKMKPIFRNKVEWRCQKKSDIPYIHRYKLKMVSTVELKCYGYQISLHSLCKALVDTKRISSFVITELNHSSENLGRLDHFLRITNRWKKLTLRYKSGLDDYENPINKEMLKKAARLKNCKDVSSLNLSFNCQDNTKSKLLKVLSREIQRLPKLKNLNIDISACYSMGDSDEEDENEDENDSDDDDPNSPLLKFKYPRSLSFLHLDFESVKSEGSVNTLLLPKFTSSIQKCRFLDHMSLDFRMLAYHMEFSEAQIWTCLAEKTSSLKTLKIKKTLLNYEFEANKAYLESFQHLKTLENLTIDLKFESSEEQSHQTLSTIFFTHLASFTNLKSLDLTLSCENNHPSFLHLLTLQSFSQLERLRLNLIYYYDLNGKFLKNLALILPRNLKHFKLILPKSTRITDESIIAFSSGLKQLSQLKDLDLNLQNININPKVMEKFSSNIAHLNPTSLRILLSNQPEAPKSSVLGEYQQKRLTSLCSALCGWNSLENLSLNLSVFEGSTKEFKHFALALKELKQLRSLSLELPQFDSGKNFEGLKKFLLGVKELKRLDSLHLSFQGKKLSSKEVELVALNLQNFSQYLENLDLYFKHAWNVGNEVLNYLGLGLQSLLSLKNLSLQMGKEKIFQKEAGLDLLKKMVILKGLESLVINFRFPRGDPEIRSILNEILRHQNLKRLTKFIFDDLDYI